MKEEKAVVAASAGQPCRAGGHNVSPVPVWGAAQTIVQRGGGAREVVALRCDGLDFPPRDSQSLPRICVVSKGAPAGHTSPSWPKP